MCFFFKKMTGNIETSGKAEMPGNVETPGIQDVPNLPLRRILDFLDNQSRRNLLDATEFTVMGMEIKRMARQRRYVCPDCIIFKGVGNMEKIYAKPELVSISRLLKLGNAFDFFFSFQNSISGNENYRHKVVDVRDPAGDPMTVLEPRKIYIEKVKYTWSERISGHENWLDVINDIRERKEAYESERERLWRIFFGGTFDGITIERDLKIYTRQEFENHIIDDHGSAGTIYDDLNRQEFWIWVDKYAQRGRLTFIPRSFYSNGNIEINELLSEIRKIVMARYYKHRKTTNSTIAQALGTEEDYILWEARKIFWYACKSFKRILFPTENNSRSEKSLYKFFDMYLRTIDAVLR